MKLKYELVEDNRKSRKTGKSLQREDHIKGGGGSTVPQVKSQF